jgi:hypothetical protein
MKRQIKTLLLYHLSFLHALMKFKDIDKISRNLRNALMKIDLSVVPARLGISDFFTCPVGQP